MAKKVVIFGTSDIAEIAHFYFLNDSDHDIVAFTVDEAYLDRQSFQGLPVVPFEDIQASYPPSEYCLFVALSYSKINQIRRDKFEAGLNMGYDLVSYVSSKATVLNPKSIGRNCFILENNTIQPFSTIGDNVTLWSGNHIGHHSVVSSHTFVSSHVVISGGVTIGEQCFIGVNATLRDHITVGSRCVIGAGSLILSDVADNGVYVGEETERSRVPSHRLRSI